MVPATARPPTRPRRPLPRGGSRSTRAHTPVKRAWVRTAQPWLDPGPNADRPYDVPARDVDGHKTHATASAAVAMMRGQKRRKSFHEEDAQQHELAQLAHHPQVMLREAAA